jgi:hypothetical protein
MRGLLRQQRALACALALLSLLLTTFCALLSSNAYWHEKLDVRDLQLLTVSNALAPSNLLPRTYFERIKTLRQVQSVSEYSSIAMFIANERQVYIGVIVDKEELSRTFPRLALDPAELGNWQLRKDAILVSKNLLASQKLKVGGTVAARLFHGAGEQNQQFYIAGTFGPDNELKCTSCIFLGRDFADLALPSYRGIVGSYHVRLTEQANREQTRKAIDELFADQAISTHSTGFLPAGAGFVNNLIDLRQLVQFAFWMTLATAVCLPALCANMLATDHKSSLALLMAFGCKRIQILWCAFGLTALGAMLMAGIGTGLAWLAGTAWFGDVVWLRFESQANAAIGATAIGGAIAATCYCAVAVVIRKIDVGHLFNENRV